MPKRMLAIALCRVSSLEQLENHSLSHQRDNVLRAADELGVSIPEDGIWSGHVSSKKGVNYNRKDLKAMLEYCRKHPNVKYLIVQEVDRFMRSPDEQVYFQVKFQNEVGVKIWYADKPELNKDDIYAGLMRYMEGFRAAGSNDERQRKSINGQTKALQDGRFPFAPKPGYNRGTRTGIQEIHPVRGTTLKAILIKIATRQLSPPQGLVELNRSAFTKGRSPYRMDKFRKIITDPFYAGIVEIKKQVNVRNENGLHEALITKAQHLELVRIMDNKKKNQSGPRKNGNPKYPLDNLVSCDDCREKPNGRVVGFDHTNGKSSKVYEKYRCRGCGKYLTRDELHSQVVKLFQDHSISEEGMNDLIEALDTVWKQREGHTEQESVSIQHRIKSMTEDISRQALAAIDPDNMIIKKEILNNISNMKQQILTLEDSLSLLQTNAEKDEGDFLTFAFNFVDTMGENFLEISPENRLKCKQIIFPSGFSINKQKKVYTPEISPLVRLAINKKDLSETEKSFMVRVQGL
jgi:DNA invertase Pin-like site-specific DNA recombinase